MSGFDETEGHVPDLNPAFSDAQRKRFREDKDFFLQYRKGIESEFNQYVANRARPEEAVCFRSSVSLILRYSFFDALHQASPVQAMLRGLFEANMRKSLAKKPELADVLIPKW
jgi:hypothetical protein